MEAICRSDEGSAEIEEYDTEEFGEVEVGLVSAKLGASP